MKSRPDLRNTLYIIAGFFFVALGAIGIVLPILPTTPFLLIAAGLFLRSSGRLYLWLTNHRYLGPFIRNYRLYRAVPLSTKLFALIFLYITIGYSLFFVLENWWLRIPLLGIAVWATIHITHLRTLTKEMRVDIDRREALKAQPFTSGVEAESAGE
jgi:hypothetical protein